MTAAPPLVYPGAGCGCVLCRTRRIPAGLSPWTGEQRQARYEAARRAWGLNNGMAYPADGGEPSGRGHKARTF
jgi:hypothetical protein